MQISILAVDVAKIGAFTAVPVQDDMLDELKLDLDQTSVDAQNLMKAAGQLKSSDIPVAFPTETVYGLGADATRSAAVRGIYKAKQRPSDNPLIVHFASLAQLRSLLKTSSSASRTSKTRDESDGPLQNDPIPEIYKPLISNFWPGPLTIILPNPENSLLAPEVTAGLKTFGARIPRHVLATALIQLAGVPVAAPSANASTKPSPTAAEHVAYDLDGRIETIIDGGPCDVGVESTVVDGLSQPPLILRPGGISLERIRRCPGWEQTEIGYKSTSEKGSQPKAPGMKYRHYSPKATVVLYEAGRSPPSRTDMLKYGTESGKVGVIRTKSWAVNNHGISRDSPQDLNGRNGMSPHLSTLESPGFAGMLETLSSIRNTKTDLTPHAVDCHGTQIQLLDISLGPATADIARGIFSSLRDLDKADVAVIFVEGIDDDEGETAAAIMNRLRKAAEIRVED